MAMPTTIDTQATSVKVYPKRIQNSGQSVSISHDEAGRAKISGESQEMLKTEAVK